MISIKELLNRISRLSDRRTPPSSITITPLESVALSDFLNVLGVRTMALISAKDISAWTARDPGMGTSGFFWRHSLSEHAHLIPIYRMSYVRSGCNPNRFFINDKELTDVEVLNTLILF